MKKDVSPMVPRSPTEIVADALGCIDAGATIVHNHNDEYLWAEGGVHSAAPYIEAWGPILVCCRSHDEGRVIPSG